MENVFYIDRLAYFAFPLNLIAGIFLVGVIIFFVCLLQGKPVCEMVGGYAGNIVDYR